MAVISNMVSMNYSYFSKLFKDETGMKFSDYLISIRMQEAKKLLDNVCIRIGEAAVKVGYSNPKHFTRAFKNYYGISPEQYKKGN